MPRLLLVLGAWGCLVGNGEIMNGQQRTYDDSALRVEGRHGDMRIVRGSEGVVVGKLGTFHGVDLAKLVGSSERATVEAKQFARDYGPGTSFLAVGIVLLGTWMGVSRIDSMNTLITTGLLLGGTGLIVYGGSRLQHAYNALARSIWWYNRDLRE